MFWTLDSNSHRLSSRRRHALRPFPRTTGISSPLHRLAPSRRLRPAVTTLEDRTLLSLLATETMLSDSVTSPIYGQTETLTAQVSPIAPNVGVPTGTVTFYDGSTALATVPLTNAGGVASASLSTSSLAVGTHSIRAAYGGDASFAGSVSRNDITSIADYSRARGYGGDGGPATAAMLHDPSGVAVDAQGDVFIADQGNNAIRKVRPDGTIITVAGDGSAGYGGDGGPATAAELWLTANGSLTTAIVNGLAVDAHGDLFIADTANCRVREVTPDGTITTVAGNGSGGYSGDGGPATAASLQDPTGLAVDGAGDLFIADSGNGVIREVQPGGTITTIRAAGGYFDPQGLAVDSSRDLFIADPVNGVVREVTPGPDGLLSDGTMKIVAGNGSDGYTGDGGPATAAGILGVTGLAVDGQGDLFLTEAFNDGIDRIYADAVREVTPDGTIRTVAGGSQPNFGGDGGPATAAALDLPADVAVDAAGDLYIADYVGNAVRRVGDLVLIVSPDATTTAVTVSATAPVVGQSVTITATVAPVAPGSGSPTGTVTFYDGIPDFGTATPIGTAPLTASGGVSTATLATSSLAVGAHTFAAVYDGDANFGGSSSLQRSYFGDGNTYYFGIAVDAQDNIIVENGGANQIQEIQPDGTVLVIAGNTGPGYTGDGGPAAAAEINLTYPYNGTLALDARGDLFFSDTGNNVVREVMPGPDGLLTDGTITTVAGSGAAGYGGDGGTATAAQLNAPSGVAVDGAGDLFIADYGNGVIREVKPDGTISTYAAVAYPTGLAVDSSGDLFVANGGGMDWGENGNINEIRPDGTNATLGGPGAAWGLAVDGAGDVFATDYTSSDTGQQLWELQSSGGGQVITVGYGPDLLPAATLAVDGAGDLYYVSYDGVASIERIGGTYLDVRPMTSSGLQAALNDAAQGGAGGSVTLSTTSDAAVSAAVQAVNNLPSPSPGTSETVTLDLGGGTYTTDTHIQAPPGVTVVITDGTLIGGSPALIVDSGTVVLDHVTATNATNAPTIVVTGGSLIVRDSTIQESTGFGQTALWVTGGSVDLGTAADPGGNLINVNGAGQWAHNASGQPISAVGTTFTVDGAPAPSTLSGLVFEDFNDDGQVDFGEQGIAGVPITLTGTDDLGNPVNLSQTTDADGTYVFLSLRPGTYTITEAQQPAGYTPGIASVGTGGGTASGAQFTGIGLAAGQDAMNYNFGEIPAAGGPIQHGQTASIGFWNNKNGQALIKALNGGTGTQLGDWLAATFPHIFGASAGSNDLAGEGNAAVAALFQADFVVHGQKLDAQVLATALAVYVTDSTLDSTGVGTQYGFVVGGNGVATATINVGSNGAAFGVADNTTLTVMDILLATDAQAVNGVLYGGDATKRTKANTVFSAINQAGGL